MSLTQRLTPDKLIKLGETYTDVFNVTLSKLGVDFYYTLGREWIKADLGLDGHLYGIEQACKDALHTYFNPDFVRVTTSASSSTADLVGHDVDENTIGYGYTSIEALIDLLCELKP